MTFVGQPGQGAQHEHTHCCPETQQCVALDQIADSERPKEQHAGDCDPQGGLDAKVRERIRAMLMLEGR